MKNIAVGLLFFVILLGGYAGMLLLFWYLGRYLIPVLLALVVGIRSYVGDEKHNVL
jgi:hypothetical protein